MSGIWVYSETEEITAQLLNIGRQLADGLQQKVTAVATQEQDGEAMIKKGADNVMQFTAKTDWPENYAKPLSELLAKNDPTVILIGGTLRGKTVASYIAAKLQTGYINNSLALEVKDGVIESQRVMYSGKALCIEELAKGSLVTMEPRTYDAAEIDGARQGKIEKCDLQPDNQVTVGKVTPAVHHGTDIATADRLVCVGRGFSKKEDLHLAENLAAKLNAEICCTRGIAEDYQWLPLDKYVGLSGAKVKPQLYISFGVSGQVQHVAGMRGSKVVVAVDTNEKAPIFEAADYGIVGDLYEVAPLLLKALNG